MTATALSPVYALNPQLHPDVLWLGQEQTPLLVLDQVLAEPQRLRQQAAASSFAAPQRNLYPGLRAPLPRDYVVALVQALLPMLRQWYQIPAQLKARPGDLAFSLISKTPEQLQPMQRLPHFDTTEPYVFAVLHYLNPNPHGGTGFFRQRATGFERITAEREPVYFTAAQAYLNQHGLAPGYLTGSDGQYELYQRLDYKENRVVVYPGNLLHSSLIQPQSDISSAIPGGRLTANLFIRFSH